MPPKIKDVRGLKNAYQEDIVIESVTNLNCSVNKKAMNVLIIFTPKKMIKNYFLKRLFALELHFSNYKTAVKFFTV